MPLSSRTPEVGALDVLLSVARTGSLGRAAAEQSLSQSAVGSRIKYLEGLLGLALIERSALGSRLTPDGAMVVEWAREVVAAASRLDEGVTALRTGHGSRVRIAASLTVAEYLVPGWLADLRARRPQSVVSLRVVNSAEVARLVLAGEVGVGFVEGPHVPDGLEQEVVARDRLVAVVAPGHEWPRRDGGVTSEELAGTPLVQREPGSGTRETVEQALTDGAGVVDPVVELSSTTAIKSAVRTGAGPAVLSFLAVADDLRRGDLVAVEVVDADLTRRLQVVWASGRRLSAEDRDVVAVARLHPGG